MYSVVKFMVENGYSLREAIGFTPTGLWIIALPKPKSQLVYFFYQADPRAVFI